MTAHRLLYTSYPRKDGTFYHKPKRPLDQNYKLIVVDEISMLPKEMWDLLLSHHIYVIALGDPEQLPPISGDNDVLSHPHIFLDEIMRQAQESEIIRISMDVREGKPLQLYNGNEVKIIDKNKFETGMCLWADQIIVAKNDTRRNINSLMRRYLFEVDNEEPVVGDKLICLKNDWDNMNGIGDINVNGTIGYVKNISYNRHHQWLHPMLTLDFIPDYYNPVDIYNYGEDKLYFKDLNVDYKLLTTGEPTINKIILINFQNLLDLKSLTMVIVLPPGKLKAVSMIKYYYLRKIFLSMLKSIENFYIPQLQEQKKKQLQ